MESRYERTEAGQEVLEDVALELEPLGKGPVQLTVTVTDDVGNRTTSEIVNFEIR